MAKKEYTKWSRRKKMNELEKCGVKEESTKTFNRPPYFTKQKREEIEENETESEE